MGRKRFWLALVLALALSGAMFAAACGGDEGGKTPGVEGAVPGGTLLMYIGEPSFIDPALAFESEGIKVDSALFEPLLNYNPLTLELELGVAESYESNEDATVWTFRLKQGTKFHNGREVVAEDFKYAWERLSNPDLASNYGSFLSMVKGYQEYYDKAATEITGIKVVDDYTLEVTMGAPFGEFPYIVAFSDCSPVPKEEIEGKEEAWNLKPIGNGPFMMSEDWVAGQYIKVVQFPDYSGTKAYVDGIDFKIYTDINTAWTDFQAGSLDWTQIPSGNYATSVATYPVMSNVHLRRAVSLAINRQAICDTVYEGIRSPADGIIPPGLPGYEPNMWQYNHYSVEEARAELEAAGYPNGEGLPTLKLTFNTGAGHDDLMQLVKADLDAVGIPTEFDTSDGPTYWSKVDADEYQIGRSGWIADYPTMDDFLYVLFYSTSPINFTNYNNPAVDQALDEARQIADTDARIAAYQAISKTIGDDCPEAVICPYAHHNVTSARVHNLVYSAMGLHNFTTCWISE
jgi:oligopeptide transport system substrate-binding protein